MAPTRVEPDEVVPAPGQLLDQDLLVVDEHGGQIAGAQLCLGGGQIGERHDGDADPGDAGRRLNRPTRPRTAVEDPDALDRVAGTRPSGPLLAIFLVGLVGVRSAIGLSVIPGLLAALAIVYAIRHTPRAQKRECQRIRLVRPTLSGPLGHLLVAIAAFEFGNVAVTLFILRATQLLEPGRSHTSAVQLALGLYVAYNVAATLVSVPAGHIGDRGGSTLVLTVGVA